MKRTYQQSYSDDSNTTRNSKDDGPKNSEFRFLIPSRAAGFIIGEGGKNVKELRTKFDIKINVSDSSGPERILILTGLQPQLYSCLEEILEKIAETIPASEAPFYTGSRNKKRPDIENDESKMGTGEDDVNGVDVRMLIHQNIAGGIIGRRGERIQKLRYDVKLKDFIIHQDMCPESTDRIIQMVDEIPNVINCIKCVMKLIEDEALKVYSEDLPYDARNYDEAHALLYGGWLSKSAFLNMKKRGADRNSMMGGRNSRRDNRRTESKYSDGSDSRSSRRSHYDRDDESYSSQPQFLRPPAVQRSVGNVAMMNSAFVQPYHNDRISMLGGFGAPAPAFEDFEEEIKTVQVSVPEMYMGAIMGKGAKQIRSIREESRAIIRIHDSAEDGEDRIIDITGTQEQIGYAQHLLKLSVLENPISSRK